MPSLKSVEQRAMQHEPEEEAPPYIGSFVVLRPDGLDYVVTLEPPLPDLSVPPASFPCKSQAWGHARQLWSANRLPFRNYCDAGVGLTGAHDAAEARKSTLENNPRF